MNTIMNISPEFENKDELKSFVGRLIGEKLESSVLSNTGESLIRVQIKKVGSLYNVHIKMKYKNKNFQFLKKDKNVFKAISLGIKGVKRLYLENVKKISRRFDVEKINQIKFETV